MTQLWAIQTKLGKEDSTLHMVDAFQKLGLNWAAFPLIPFQHHVPDLRWESGPIVYYGSTGLIQRVWSDPDLLEGAKLFWDPGTHAPSYYGRRLGREWLNDGAQFLTVGDIFKMYPSEERFFIRPDSGGKLFEGQVDTLRSIRDTLDRHRQNDATGRMNMDTRVVLGPLVQIEREYRTWVIGGEVAAIVGYKKGHRVEPWAPFDTERAEVYQYAEAQGARLADLEAFVLDVARLPDGTLKVVEINDIHAAGFYDPDVILDVVAELSNYVAKTGGGGR